MALVPATSAKRTRSRYQNPEQLVEAATTGDRKALARLISLVEYGDEDAREVGRLVYPRTGRAYTVGITGAPGSGKSTLVDRLIAIRRNEGASIGVLAVDPSSPFTGGAILGDRVRMQNHATDPGVFIRSMATRGHMGGLALATPEAVRVLDAAGLPWVLVETVGVGQVEVEIAGAADTTVVVVNPRWGDAVQANKAGLLEVADVFVINKADRPGTQETQRDLEGMLELSTLGEWHPPIVRTVAATGDGADEVWGAVADHRSFLERSGQLAERRSRRLTEELREIVARRLEDRAHELCRGSDYDRLHTEVVERRLDPWSAAEAILAGIGT
jgi:LAO/AO transport system kinase